MAAARRRPAARLHAVVLGAVTAAVLGVAAATSAWDQVGGMIAAVLLLFSIAALCNRRPRRTRLRLVPSRAERPAADGSAPSDDHGSPVLLTAVARPRDRAAGTVRRAPSEDVLRRP